MSLITEQMPMELVVTPVGNAMLLYKGHLDHAYVWAQYEPYTKKVELVTDEGHVQPLTFTVSPEMEKPLLSTRELLLVCMNAENTIESSRLIKFTALGE